MSLFKSFGALCLAVASLLVTLPTVAQDSGIPQVLMSTSKGDFVLELDAERAPKTVENFLRYVEEGFYEQTLFHRVIEGFMIQGGGFSTQYQRKTTHPPVDNEAYNGLRNTRYTIAMARTTDPHSATSQFFINSEDNGNLDHTSTTARGWGYTVFGRVVQGQDIVDEISRVQTGSGGPFSRDVPIEPVVIFGAQLMGNRPVVRPAVRQPIEQRIDSKVGRKVTNELDSEQESAIIQSQPAEQN
jgi:peptidyl-prolyl cis-trans isomerase B (cyclophilin B)